jgi:hypothetical protein
VRITILRPPWCPASGSLPSPWPCFATGSALAAPGLLGVSYPDHDGYRRAEAHLDRLWTVGFRLVSFVPAHAYTGLDRIDFARSVDLVAYLRRDGGRTVSTAVLWVTGRHFDIFGWMDPANAIPGAAAAISGYLMRPPSGGPAM